MANWTWAAASCRGTSHEKNETRRQDAFSCFTYDGSLVAIVSDGAGSASMGGEGASLVCRSLSGFLKSHLTKTSELPTDAEIAVWINTARTNISTASHTRDLEPRDFAATLVCTVSDGSQTLVIHIGDGAAVVQSTDTLEWSAISWPENGEYASSTFFVTDQPEARVRITRANEEICSIAIFSDGIERLALDFANNTPHSPFFEGIFNPVRESKFTGRDHPLCLQLKSYLNSDAINARTDDDKTLILASVK